MASQLWMGQFNIVHGEVREEGPFVGVYPAPDEVDAAADLYVVAEPALPGSEAYCDQLVAAVGQLFHSTDLSVTGRLQQALRAAHESLREWNRKSLPEHWVAAGVSCLAAADGTAYFAMVGPSAVYLRSGDQVRRLEPLSPASREPLGSSEQFFPHFARAALRPGDLVLLASSGIRQLVDEATLQALLALPPEDILPELYLLARREENFAALVVSWLEAPTPSEPDDIPAAGDEDRPEPRAAPGPGARPEGRERSDPAPPTPAADEAGPAEQWARSRVDPEAFAARLPDPRLRPERPVVDLRNKQDQDAGASPATEPASAGEAPANRPGGTRPRTPSKAYPALSQRRVAIPVRPLVVVAIALGLLALTWVTLPDLLADSKAERYDKLVQRAEAAYEAAQSEADVDHRHELLVQADTDLQEARQIAPERWEAEDLAAKVGAALDELDARVALTGLTKLADLGTSGVAPQAATELAVGEAVYVLDASEGNVLALPIREGEAGQAPDIVFAPGRRVDGVETGKATHLTWVPGKDAYLLVLDQNRRAFAVRGDNLNAVTIRGSGEWDTPRATRVFNGSLYVLDAGDGSIYRYGPTSNGFDSAPETVLEGADLAKAVDFAVASDTFVLMGDGKVRRFAGGKETEFRVTGLDYQPLASPSAMVLSARNQHLYIADGGNRRVVVIGQDGRFRQQLVDRQITTINSIALDEAGDSLVLAAGQMVLSAPVPELPG